MQYHIKIDTALDESWVSWLGIAEIQTIQEKGRLITLLAVDVPDQPALFGILDRIRNMNLTLISIARQGENDCQAKIE